MTDNRRQDETISLLAGRRREMNAETATTRAPGNSSSSAAVLHYGSSSSPSGGGGGSAGLLMMPASIASAAVSSPNNNNNNNNNKSLSPSEKKARPPKRAWSLHQQSSLLGSARSGSSGDDDGTTPSTHADKKVAARQAARMTTSAEVEAPKGGVAYYLIYAAVNIIISVPGLYGYAAVIFNHPIFQPHMNALSKLVLFSSLMHQLGFTLFSGLPFAIGTVQDAGLIFLSTMSNDIARAILVTHGDDGNADASDVSAQIVSTTLVLLALGTASLGLVLILMGKFRLADAVSYLPMPVIAGYLAFIGYFCLQAGVALCISQPMTSIMDWKYLLEGDNALLAFPGLAAGLLLTWISRTAPNDAALPATMVVIPVVFYVIIFATGSGLDGAREAKWVGEEAPPVPVSDLVGLVDMSLVQWHLVKEILFTWVGMVFVVSFASCLDVAAISMDMGEALDTNKELATVGICNVMSGLTLGFTGSYIFSQTIFTYRTGVHSRWIGIIIMFMFLYVVTSPINLLSVAPLFFLGSTLIFIGYDLIFEWLFEISAKIFLSEYAIVWATFIAIQIVGMDAGIVIGVLVSLVDHVVVSATATAVNRVKKKSRSVWRPEESKILQNHAYHPVSPKIVTLEVVGTVFFGSSLLLLQRLTEEVGIDLEQEEEAVRTPTTLLRSPHTPTRLVVRQRRQTNKKDSEKSKADKKATVHRTPPKFVVLDLTQLSNLDASASRGCFLQFTKMCAKKGIIVCATAPSTRIDWMLRSHDAAYDIEEENKIKALFQADLAERTPAIDSRHRLPATLPKSERCLLFLTTYEALEFCEKALLQQMNISHSGPLGGFHPLLHGGEASTLALVFQRILGDSISDMSDLHRLNGHRYHEEITYDVGEPVFDINTHSDAFYVVLKGAVAVAVDASSNRQGRQLYRQKQTILSGAGLVQKTGSSSNLLDPLLVSTDETMAVASMWPVGGIFGYVDFLLQRPRVYRAVAANKNTVCAKITHSRLNLLQNEDPRLDALLQRVLLQVSILDLANCTCDE